MDRMLLEAFVREVGEQCVFALRAANGINAGLRSGASQEQIWLSIRTLLTAAANISNASGLRLAAPPALSFRIAGNRSAPR